jgi:hypothetical protein
VRSLAISVALALAALAYGCRERVHPWDQGDTEPPTSSFARDGGALLPGLRASGNAATANESDGDGGADEDDKVRAPTPPVRVGGPWVRCYGNFQPSGEPVKDVTRLSLLCGPENGMRRFSKQPLEGSVEEGGRPVSETFEVHRGECYRVFAVAEPAVLDLDATVHSSRGATVAADHSEDSWPIAQPDRPFCPLEDDHYTVEISAHRGRGRFAAEVWALRSLSSDAAPSEPH